VGCGVFDGLLSVFVQIKCARRRGKKAQKSGLAQILVRVPVGVCGAWRRFFGAVGVHFLRFFGARGAFFLRVFGRNNARRGAWRGPGKCPGGLARAIFTGANPHKTGVSAFVHRERL